mmetsp:Transcript_28814/g.81178  ORF Transcript_28814/g.81178 Transcript_28814/m.81178 type:complete len:361 (+) Transcript_28814:264-1346(+)|eukprot:CAMPEP_0117654278 /NCGR_PEP_ID=MMETSP0804-20121206/3657_1 /TAXON_ID=1074897 /ORGANISM="Tetraselmis astigmatica, Strain CCMP880" /LENGTH=360 /DNA_ID=CAMNT_0005460545 /DNA_START=259 /DNA_END=1341 /DNA_ORIENTATION=+
MELGPQVGTTVAACHHGLDVPGRLARRDTLGAGLSPLGRRSMLELSLNVEAAAKEVHDLVCKSKSIPGSSDDDVLDFWPSPSSDTEQNTESEKTATDDGNGVISRFSSAESSLLAEDSPSGLDMDPGSTSNGFCDDLVASEPAPKKIRLAPVASVLPSLAGTYGSGGGARGRNSADIHLVDALPKTHAEMMSPASETSKVDMSGMDICDACTPLPHLDSPYGDLPESCLSSLTDDSLYVEDRQNPGGAVTQGSSSAAYIGNTNLPQDGWMQCCRGCGQFTGASVEVLMSEVSLCRRCQSKWRQALSPPTQADGVGPPCSLTAKLLHFADPAMLQLDWKLALEDSLIKLDERWTTYLEDMN